AAPGATPDVEDPVGQVRLLEQRLARTVLAAQPVVVGRAGHLAHLAEPGHREVPRLASDEPVDTLPAARTLIERGQAPGDLALLFEIRHPLAQPAQLLLVIAVAHRPESLTQ